MENEFEQQEALETPDVNDTETTDDTGENGEVDVDTSAIQEANKKLFERAKKAEAKLENLQKSLKSQSTPKAPTPSLDLERLDKLELRMLDKDLSAEQVTDILLLKNAKGLADVSEAYNHPMIQTWLQQTRSEKAKDDSIKKATPKAQRSVAPSGETKKGVELSKSKNWVEKLPSDNLDAVAQALTENFFADDK